MGWSFRKDDGIGHLTIDVSDRPVNTLGREVMEQLEEHLVDLEEASLGALLVRSGKDGTFIAGADIKEIQRIDEEEEAHELARVGQTLFQRLSELPYPTVALIDGACLGGGFELALACDYRIASDGDRTQIGCPEVKLGIIPAWGGTQRLPRLVGLKDAIDKLLNGESYSPSEALRCGVVDSVLDENLLEKEARSWIENDDFPNQSNPGWPNWAPVRWYILRQAQRQTAKETHGNMPAPPALIRAVRRGLKTDLENGLEIEAEEFARLATTPECRNLIRVFFLREGQKKFGLENGSPPSPPSRVGVIGAGTMGSGIAHWVSSRDREVALVDIDPDAVNQGMKRIRQLYDQGIRAGAVNEKEKRRGLRRLHPGVDYDPLRGCELIFEAVLEEMEVKERVLEQLGPYLDEDTIIASNTSALPVGTMGKNLPDPGNMVGLHFFNPVYRMPLVEVIETEQTHRQTLNRAIEFVKSIGKIPVLVRDRPGFLVNRILVPYLNEAGHLLDEGHAISRIDETLTDFGMPMGPLRLIDEVGIDVGYHVARHLSDALDPSYPIADSFTRIFEDGLTGKKGGEGFYRGYDNTEQPNPAYDATSVSSDEPERITRRLIDLMVAEAVRCLEEQVVGSADELDTAMILGTGFAPFRGGLLRHADDYGLPDIVQELETFRDRHGPRYRVPDRLRSHADQGETFTRKNG